MTFGQLFKIMNPYVRICKNGTCMWLYFDDVNYYTIGTEWWDKEIPDNAIAILKDQEPLMIHNRNFTATCPECHLPWMMWQPDYMRYCPYCGKAVKWDE